MSLLESNSSLVNLKPGLKSVKPGGNDLHSALSKLYKSFKFKPNHWKVLECLLNRGDKESLEEVAERAGVSRVTIYRYLKDNDFLAIYYDQVNRSLGADRSVIARKLLQAAKNPGQQQIPAINLYYKLQGLLNEPGTQVNVNIDNSSNHVDLNALPTVIKKLLIYVFNGGVLDKRLEGEIDSFCNENLNKIKQIADKSESQKYNSQEDSEEIIEGEVISERETGNNNSHISFSSNSIVDNDYSREDLELIQLYADNEVFTLCMV